MTQFIALSDVHLGQNGRDKKGQYSLLSQVPDSCPREKQRADEALNKLRAEVAAFAGKENNLTLIVAGDLFDLALAYIDDALRDLSALLNQLPQVKQLVWVVGNHDHHIWTLHSEETHCLSRLREGKNPSPGGVYRATSSDGEPLSLLQKTLSVGAGRDIDVKIAYPAFRLKLTDNTADLPPGSKDVLFYFTHGHLFGGLYTTITQILKDRLPGFHAEQVAATVNLSLIELIYWLLGETGEGFGADGLVESIYTDLQKGTSSLAKELVSVAVDRLLPDGIITGIPDLWERSAVKELGYYLLKKACAEVDPNTSKDRHQSTSDTERAMAEWAIKIAQLPTRTRVNMIYGHTHVADLHSIHSTLINGYNLGSWLVEPGLTDPDTQLLMIEAGADRLDVKWKKV